MSAKLDPKALADLIEAFLCINPSPSDQQFHALAEALGVDKEQLEAVSYNMLGQEVQEDEHVGIDASSTHFSNEDDLVMVDPDECGECEEEIEVEACDEHPGQVIMGGKGVKAQSTHFEQGGEDLAARQDAMDEIFGKDTDLSRVGASTRIRAARILATTEAEDILSGEYDESETTSDDLSLNDGQMEYNNPNPGFQQETTDDGADALDRGVGLTNDQALLNQDGIASPEIVDKDGDKVESSVARARVLKAAVPNKVKNSVIQALRAEGIEDFTRRGDNVLIFTAPEADVIAALDKHGWILNKQYREIEKDGEDYVLAVTSSGSATQLEFVYMG